MKEETKQQWRWSYDGHGGISIDAVDGRQIAFVRHGHQANAALLAAAPELLAACESLPLDMLDREDRLDAAEFVDNSESFIRAMRLARDAITSATTASHP